MKNPGFYIKVSSLIPELTIANRITNARLFMSIASAFIIYIFLKFGLNILKFNINGNYLTIIAVSFVAGFSERLVLRVVGGVVGK